MKFSIESTASYNSIHPSYQYTEQFANNAETYREGTKWFGVFLAFLSGTFFTISSALVKAIQNVDPMVLLAIRSILQMLVMAGAAIKASKSLFGPKGQRILLHFQGIVGGATLSLLYYSFRKLAIGDATTIIFSSPVIVIALSFIFLKEPCGILRVMVVCALFAGVVFVSKPPFLFQVHRSEPYNIMGYICAILATFFTALNIVIMRKCSEIHYSTIIFNISWWSVVTSVFFFFLVSEHHEQKLKLSLDWITWAKILLVAFTGLCGQILVTNALKIEGAGKVSVTRSLDIILAYVVQVYFFGDHPSSTSIVGAFLVVISVICMGFEKEIYSVCDFIP
ncbi:PREDICTED: solute carrier family 35 member G1-like [Dufourea novaeangliae]|uniref:Solute carrier family 35 member G1 n=1 Tax=Dufourea novaeangliae TaxID=178035 RepID=A0A154P3B6_DUFNO|nr:PREDICTED: solute carrier family 35 member G1-like [Dufourea novaeangliae]KZC06361.1 Solute carrier family 35 member G1 [Dufourea novaeangliae]